MPITTIPWGDGSGDNIYLSAPSQTGDQSVSVTSDPNTGAARSKVVTFDASGVTPVTLTITQDAGTPTPIFSLVSPSSTQNYDTGVKLFDTPKSFTILCDAKFNDYGWTAWTQGVFGIGTGYTFKFGSINSGKDYQADVLQGTGNRYCAIIMNSTESDKRCSSIYARQNSLQDHRFAITYDHTTRKVWCRKKETNNMSLWFTIPADIVNNDTLKLLIGNASGTINVFDVYDTILPDQAITDFLTQ